MMMMMMMMMMMTTTMMMIIIKAMIVDICVRIAIIIINGSVKKIISITNYIQFVLIIIVFIVSSSS